MFTNEELTRMQQASYGRMFEMTPRLDAAGRLINGDRLAPAVAAQYGYRAPQPKEPGEFEKGAQYAKSLSEFNRGAQSVLGGGAQPVVSTPNAATPAPPLFAAWMGNAVPRTRVSELSNDSAVDERMMDNERGPHLGADGRPGMWNVPTQVAGRVNGLNLTPDAGAPNGTTIMQDGNGLFKLWQGGRFGNARFASMADAAANRPISTLNTPPVTEPASTRSLEDDRDYIRRAGYQDFLDRAAAEPAAQPHQASSAMAPAYSVKGVLQRAGTPDEWAMAPANLAAFPGRVLDNTARGIAAVTRGLWNGNYSLPPSLAESAGNSVGRTLTGSYEDWLREPVRPTRSPRPQDFDAMSELGAYSGAPTSLPDPEDIAASHTRRATAPSLLETSLTATPSAAIRAAFTPVNPYNPFVATRNGQPAPVPSPIRPAPRNPIVPAPRVSPVVPAPSRIRPAPYQTTADLYNPFRSGDRNRQRASIMPE